MEKDYSDSNLKVYNSNCQNKYNEADSISESTNVVLSFYWRTIAFFILTLTVFLTNGQQEHDPWRDQTEMRYPPLWYNFDNDVVVKTYEGYVQGFSVPWHIEDEIYYDPKFN